MVKLFQTHKHHIAYFAGGGFSLHFVCKGVLYIVNKVFHIINTNRTLFDSVLNAFYKLLSVKRLKRAVTLVYHKLWLFHHLISGETLSAFRTLTAATLFLDARMYPEAEALLDGLKSDPNAPDEVVAALAQDVSEEVRKAASRRLSQG